MARLLNRFGARIAELSSLRIEYPVGRAGSRFEATLPSTALARLDFAQLRYFVIQDDWGNRYPAVIAQVTAASADCCAIYGAVVAHG